MANSNYRNSNYRNSNYRNSNYRNSNYKSNKVSKNNIRKGDAPAQKHYIWKYVLTGICLTLVIVLEVLARRADGFAEFYAAHVYPIWVNTVGRVMSAFGVSVSEVAVYLLVISILLSVLRIIFFAKGERPRRLGRGAMTLVVLASMLCLVYVLNCGINYFRRPFSEVEQFEVKERPVDELYSLCLRLTDDVNSYSGQVLRNKRGQCVLDSDVNERAVEAMEHLGDTYRCLSGYYPRPKKLMVSQILSVQQLTGVYSPFTVEANYNRQMTAYNIPFTACHELSHLKGFMREDEANFIAYLACISSDDADFKYSGSLLGWIYATNELYKQDKDLYEDVRSRLAEEIDADLKANTAFWAAYDGKTAELTDKVNDTYLKANAQTDGVLSYNRMVDLMLALYDTES